MPMWLGAQPPGRTIVQRRQFQQRCGHHARRPKLRCRHGAWVSKNQSAAFEIIPPCMPCSDIVVMACVSSSVRAQSANMHAVGMAFAIIQTANKLNSKNTVGKLVKVITTKPGFVGVSGRPPRWLGCGDPTGRRVLRVRRQRSAAATRTTRTRTTHPRPATRRPERNARDSQALPHLLVYPTPAPRPPSARTTRPPAPASWTASPGSTTLLHRGRRTQSASLSTLEPINMGYHTLKKASWATARNPSSPHCSGCLSSPRCTTRSRDPPMDA